MLKISCLNNIQASIQDENRLYALDYLNKIYNLDTFSIHETARQGIENEIKRIKDEDSLFLANLPKIHI